MPDTQSVSVTLFQKLDLPAKTLVRARAGAAVPKVEPGEKNTPTSSPHSSCALRTRLGRDGTGGTGRLRLLVKVEESDTWQPLPIRSGSSDVVPAIPLLSRPKAGSALPVTLAASSTFRTWASTKAVGTSSFILENSSARSREDKAGGRGGQAVLAVPAKAASQAHLFI